MISRIKGKQAQDGIKIDIKEASPLTYSGTYSNDLTEIKETEEENNLRESIIEGIQNLTSLRDSEVNVDYEEVKKDFD